jgi:hypothetical protein
MTAVRQIPIAWPNGRGILNRTEFDALSSVYDSEGSLMLRIVTAAVVLVEATWHGASAWSDPSLASIGFAAATTGIGFYTVATHWAEAFFSGAAG